LKSLSLFQTKGGVDVKSNKSYLPYIDLSDFRLLLFLSLDQKANLLIVVKCHLQGSENSLRIQGVEGVVLECWDCEKYKLLENRVFTW
jgi:hypothetical protein